MLWKTTENRHSEKNIKKTPMAHISKIREITEWHYWKKVLKMREKNPYKLRILNPMKISFKTEGDIKMPSDKSWKNLLPAIAQRKIIQKFLKLIPDGKIDLWEEMKTTRNDNVSNVKDYFFLIS